MNELLALQIVEDLKSVIVAPMFTSRMEVDGSYNRELSLFGEKIYNVLLKHLNERNNIN